MNDQERELVSLVIGYQIRNSRRSKSLSQAELAHGIGSQSMVSLLESGRQFPLPDVLSLLATRLEDGVLESYAKLISAGAGRLTDFTSTNHEVLLDVLRSHRGKWHEVHEITAIQLCDHFYYNRIFGIVCEICQLLLSHSTNHLSLAKSYFYLGSTDLHLHRYESAEHHLREAEKYGAELDDSLRARLYYNLGFTYSVLDCYGLGLWYARLAVDSFHRTHDWQRYAKSLGLLGVFQSRLGRLDEARETLQLASELCDKWGIMGSDRARIDITMADVCESQGAMHLAELWCQRAIQSSHATHDFISVSAAQRILCLVHLAKGDVISAVSAVQAAIHAAETSLDGWSVSNAYLLAAGLLSSTDEQIAAATKAFTAADEIGCTFLKALAAECIASLTSTVHPDRSHSYRLSALTSYRHHLEKSSMSASDYRYLPLTSVYDS